MNLKYFILILFFYVSVYGCEQKGLYDYSSPEGTYRTYIRQARTLRVVADHRHYRRAISCFTLQDREWFEKNFDKIEIDKEEFLYDKLYRSKKLAYVFGRSVVLIGPPPDEENFEIIEISPDVAEIVVEDYPEKIRLIKIREKWRIEGLFGVREKVSN